MNSANATLLDLEIKRVVSKSPEDKPTYDWSPAVEGISLTRQIEVQRKGEQVPFDPAILAQMVGESLTDLRLAQEKGETVTPEDHKFVYQVVHATIERLEGLASPSSGIKLTSQDLSVLVEAVLIDLGAFEVAKCLVVRRARHEVETQDPTRSQEDIRLIRRNGMVVPWDENKIEIAIRKAFLSKQLDSEPAVPVAQRVTERVTNLGQAYVQIETVQDIVQEELMLDGWFKVAEAYIVYRAERAMLRAKQTADNGADDQFEMISVLAENGDTYFWDGEDLRKRIEYARIGLTLSMDATRLEKALLRSVPSEISRNDLKKTILLNAKSLIERDADFAKFAGRILLTYIYEEVLDWDIVKDGIEKLQKAHADWLPKYIKRGIEIERLAPDMLDFDLDRLSAVLDPTADLDFDYLGIQTLYDRYLITDKTAGKPRRLETPQIFWMRVAMGLFRKEEGDREARIAELYTMYKSRRFCSSTPTLFNSGTKRSQLSSCYLYKVDDNIESIMTRGIAENAFLSKWAGGLGGSWTSVRGTGSYIKGTNGESQGVIPFLKLHNDQLVAVNQGGKRAGSGCAYLESWHNDIIDFLELRRNTGDERRRTHDMNTANWIPDLFMKRMEAREDWTLFRSSEAGDLHDLYGKAFEEKYLEYEAKAARGEIWGKKIPALDLWKSMLKLLFETGHPWITFKDPCNLRSPQDHAGVIHSSNLCTEITLNTSAEETAVCNLGSIVLDNHLLPNGELDHEKLRETVRVAVRALDNVIDINFYPTDAAKNSNLKHRPIGLGVMGLQYALFKRGTDFASEDAVEFNDEFMEAVAFYAYEASSDLAQERGKYSTYQGSKWDRGILPQDSLEILERERDVPVEVPRGAKLDWQPLRDKISLQGMRNSNVLAIAPTATIANIMGTSPCIEPVYKNMFVKSNLSGDFVVLNPYMVRDLKAEGLWTDEVIDLIKYFDGDLEEIEEIPDWIKAKYKSAFNVEYRYIIDGAARRQKWIDQSQSLNLFLKDPDLKTLSHMYRAAWHAGLKTTYYLRTQQASNIEKATVSKKKTTYTPEEAQACSINAAQNGEECEACQ
jgi:ribonucleoside-diphosphate reductase alpha chain